MSISDVSISDANLSDANLSDRLAERSVSGARARADAEVRALVAAGLAVLWRRGSSALTVADVLEEAGLSTRAFYRHFASKDELLLAVFDRDNRRSVARLEAAVSESRDPTDALEAWIGETLALGFEPRRARRTQTLWREASRLRGEFPAEFDAIFWDVLRPLVGVLERGRTDGAFPRVDPEPDARSIHAVVWALVECRLAGSKDLTASDARRYALGFCLAALGARE